MILHNNSEDFAAAIQVASEHLKMRSVYIEKDYWITFVLKNISQSSYKDRVVFKGGTSLSKAYNLIQRFSEDVDLAFISKGENQSQMKTAIKAIESQIAISPLVEKNDEAVTVKGSKFRRTVHQYPRAISQNDFGVVRDHLILEINGFTTPAPNIEVQLESYIAQALRERGQEDQVKALGLEKFAVLVLDKRRTLCEKVMAISRASYESDETHSELKNKIRHLYDVALLVADKDVSQSLGDGSINALFEDVLRDDQTTAQTQGKGPWRDSPVFVNPTSVVELMETTYKSEFAQMLHDGDKKPEISEIIKALDYLKSKITVNEA